MKLSKWTIALVGILLVILLGACSSEYGSPEDASATFFKAIEAQDKDRVEDAVCEDLRDAVPAFEYPEAEKVEYEFDLRFNTSKEEDDKAIVDVYGTIRQRITTKEADSEVKQHSREDHPLFSIELIKIGDDWKVCDRTIISQFN